MNITRTAVSVAAAGIILAGSSVAPAQAGQSTGEPSHAESARGGGLFGNCTNFNNRYPHGVGKRHARDHTSGTPVTNFRRSNRIYANAMRHNQDLDRDRDHIACEQA